ncbi:MAG: acyl-CoA reductase [Myxococcales bacterium]
MTDLEIKWPDDMAEQTRVAKGRIERAGEALRAMPLEERLRLVCMVLEDWTKADSSWRRELTVAYSEASPFHEETVREGLDAALRAWRPDALHECARRELSPILDSAFLALAPFEWTAVLAGGDLPMTTLHSGVLPLVLGSPVLMREASGDQITAKLLKRSLETRSQVLAAAFESISFSTEDVAFEELLTAPCVVATGSDQTIRSISDRLAPHQRFVAYGHQFSIGLLGSQFVLGQDSLRELTNDFALDIVRWDQTGCLSPVVIYLVGLDPTESSAFANSLTQSLNLYHEKSPRGALPTATQANLANEVAEARMRQSNGTSMLFEGIDSVVTLESDATNRPAPLHRFIRLMPVATLTALRECLGPFAGRLSSVAVSGFAPDEDEELQELLARLGVSRITKPGHLQTPPIDWPHDGMPVFSPMTRFIQSD